MKGLSPERWRQIEDIFDAALDLPADARGAFVERACAGDAELRSAVEHLLAADAVASGVLEDSADSNAAVLLGNDDSTASRVGETVGPYRIVSEVARGGMGAVYIAERVDGQFEQRVALKLVRRGMDSDDVHRRFLMERQILARLSHTNIASLLDGGQTASGQPWFAMELVEGSPITTWCDERRLGIEARLDLMTQVCDAVSYAHRNLVVHRDLKPSNILVTNDGTVKLLDFGIAKLLQEDRAHGDTLTHLGSRAMTPEYAAPEQVRGEAITTATDVYALGAVLYELLTGHRPHPFRRRSVAEFERVICNEMPNAPSSVVMRTEERERSDGTIETVEPVRVSHARAAAVTGLRKSLAGDLDTIVLKALRKEPERRYSSAEALLDDLRRRQRGLPVLARQDTLAYRARKFVARNRVSVAAGAIVVLALGAGLFATTWQARVAARQATRATVVNDFLLSLFEVSRPEQSLGREITARELLERGSRRADTALAQQPELRAELLGTLASIHSSLGDFPRADSMFSRAVRLWRDIAGGDDEPQLSAALVGWAKVQMRQGSLAHAESTLTEALAMYRRLYGPADTLVLNTMAGLALVANRNDKHERAESLFVQVIDLTRSQLGDDHIETARALGNYAPLLSATGRRAQADSMQRRALAIRRKQLPPDHPDVLLSLDNLGAATREMGNHEESEQLLRESLERRRRVQGEEHPDVAWTAGALATTLERRGELAQAESLMVVSLRLTRSLYPPRSPELARVINNIAVLNYRMERFDTAAALTRDAMSIWRDALGPEAQNTVTAMNNLGAMLTAAGRYDEAEPLLRESLRLRVQLSSAKHESVGHSLRNLGVLLHRSGRLGDAERVLRQSLANLQAALGATHPRTIDAELALGELLVARGEHAEARRLLQHALEARRESFGAGHARVAEAERALGECLTRRALYAQAEPLLLSSLKALGGDPYKRVEASKTTRSLAAMYRAWGKPDKARDAERLVSTR